jgi:hypothetical protein
MGTVFQVVLLLWRVATWTLIALVTATRLLWKLGRGAQRLPLRLRSTLPCPRGHETPVYGTWSCACGAAFDGNAFSRCRVCRRSCGWIPCVVCRLPVRNPGLS